MDDEQFRRRARRAFIRTHHPDAGGEAAAFIDGLAALENLAGEPAPRVVVVPHVHWLVRAVTALGRRAGWRRPPPRVK